MVFCSGMLPFAAAAAALRETVREECDPVHSYNDSHRDDCGTDSPSEQSETESAKDSEPGVRSYERRHYIMDFTAWTDIPIIIPWNINTVSGRS